ncbi:Leucine aminopeptidase 1 [Microsporum canis]|uniref:Probable leucine aminopeptidase MCYG_03459 n=1 Tax=Arthroderma otae (strain ATCC MYA-4605 / CBS 113480) TaxID=554155 RepID=LAP4_ARTOC|nr:leucyl aminopeptidase [Microsporum canis CBS 113480]C5FLR8.1 RecName: Full=Probable leucine aminopeptidase MCYG_03459; AltName: Full=Leucyl aminopeptidase MCYG_03459; Flags: Precursor [Microsporum canis CBS 113480]EEQ30640.1 leucyl aminopeptidase [Microsporum canis CBS 113480]
MKISTLAVVSAFAVTAIAGPVRPDGIGSDKYLIELGPGETQWVTKDQKHHMRAAGKTFIDITDEFGSGFTTTEVVPANYPKSARHASLIKPLIANLSKENLMRDLTTLTKFNNRYYESDTGVESATWILQQVQKIIKDSGVKGAKVEKFTNQFKQFNIIATIPGSSKSTVIVGAHQDSINSKSPMKGRAPGADDNGSGTVVILEAFRNILKSKAIQAANATNTLEFHWYAGEEGGLLGSNNIFKKYKADGRQVKAMLNQDLTGFTNNGKPEQLGLIADNTNQQLNEFCKMIVKQYASIPIVEAKCGYACSDHASAHRNGFPASFVAETSYRNTNPYLHTDGDVIANLNFNHMLEHAKVVLGFMGELAMAPNL